VTATPPKHRRKKLLKIFLFLGVAGAIGAIVYFNLKKETPDPTYPTVNVERGNLIDKLAETGSIELVRTVEIKSTTDILLTRCATAVLSPQDGRDTPKDTPI
jgi:hypothetical protein